MKERPKQIKIPWTEEEQQLFIDGLNIHGPKSNLYSFYLNDYLLMYFFVELKEIADHIKTRTIVQVRSHL